MQADISFGMTNEQFEDWKLQLKRRLERALKDIKKDSDTNELETVIDDLEKSLQKP